MSFVKIQVKNFLFTMYDYDFKVRNHLSDFKLQINAKMSDLYNMYMNCKYSIINSSKNV